MPAAPAATLTVDVVSDVVCPWCYIGKRRLEAALAALAEREPDVGVAVRWHPFELNPDLPREGVDRRAYLEAKFGGPERAASIYERVRAAGASVDLPLDFERIVRQPNTRAAHRLIDWAQRRGTADALVERLFRAYFVEGRAVGEHAVLAAIAGEAGLDAQAARAVLDQDDGDDVVAAAEQRARRLGIEGVPFFIFGGRVGVSGAQEPQALLDAIAQARGT